MRVTRQQCLRLISKSPPPLQAERVSAPDPQPLAPSALEANWRCRRSLEARKSQRRAVSSAYFHAID
jgi:hypothetical protein